MKAKPLEWKYEAGMRMWFGVSFRWTPASYSIRERQFKSLTWWALEDKWGSTETIDFDTVDAAKTHAEQLHQAAFAELIEKWGVKDE